MEDLVEQDGATVGGSILDYSLHLLQGISSVASETTCVPDPQTHIPGPGFLSPSDFPDFWDG